MATNDVTGDRIASKVASGDAFQKNFDAVFKPVFRIKWQVNGSDRTHQDTLKGEYKSADEVNQAIVDKKITSPFPECNTWEIYQRFL